MWRGKASRAKVPELRATLKRDPAGIVREQLSVADVASEHRVRRMASLLADFEHQDARLRRAGGKPCSKAVAGEAT